MRCPEFGDFMMNGKGEVGFRRKNVGLEVGEVDCPLVCLDGTGPI